MIRECWECGVETEEIHDHHVVPRSRGGTKTVPICGACHAKAHHRNRNMTTSALIKTAMALLKERDGRVWGNPRITETALPASIASRKAAAREFNNKIARLVSGFKKAGYSLKECVTRLNDLGVKTRRGKLWTYHLLYRVIHY